MSLLQDLQAQLADTQAKIDILLNAPEDTYPFGTIIRFAYNGNAGKFHIMKNGEESWVKLPSATGGKTIGEWIVDSQTQSIGYFEMYVMTPAESPIYVKP